MNTEYYTATGRIVPSSIREQGKLISFLLHSTENQIVEIMIPHKEKYPKNFIQRDNPSSLPISIEELINKQRVTLVSASPVEVREGKIRLITPYYLDPYIEEEVQEDNFPF